MVLKVVKNTTRCIKFYYIFKNRKLTVCFGKAYKKEINKSYSKLDFDLFESKAFAFLVCEQSGATSGGRLFKLEFS
jgi:hypothetical protein